MSGPSNVGGSDNSGGGGPVFGSYSDDNTEYSPSEVQMEIKRAIGHISGPMSEYAEFYIMFLMQEYGAQVTGQDGQVQDKMNTYLTKIQDAWSELYSANGASTTGTNDQATQQFYNTLQSIMTQVQGDKWLNAGSRAQMAHSMESTISSISGIVSGAGSLSQMWQEYNSGNQYSSGSGTPVNSANNPSAMSSLMRQLGELNQMFTGESQAVGAQTKSDMSQWQTEQDVMNNWAKALNKMALYFAQQQRTG